MPTTDIEDQNGYFTNWFQTKHPEPLRVVKKIVNPAVYIESSVYDTSHYKKGGFFTISVSDDEVYRTVPRKVKRCSCLTQPNECPCHPLNDSNTDFSANNPTYGLPDTGDSPKEIYSPADSGSNSQASFKSTDTESTVKPINCSELKLCIQSLTASKASTSFLAGENSSREDIFKEWFAKKAREKKLKELEEARIREQKEKEKQELLQEERENFRRWLARKKKDELKKKREMEQRIEKEAKKKEDKEKKLLENELRYQLWLKKKEQQKLEQKLKEQMEYMKKNEERQRRLDENVRAYQEWLKASKNKPKPLPLNQGLQSLKSSVSVTYVNPTPWIPNIDVKVKPQSQ